MNQFFTDINEIESWLDTQGIKNYHIHPDLSVDVASGVNLNRHKLSSIPVQFGHVSEFFECQYNTLSTLTGCPKSVGSHFNCSHNGLTDLVGAPSVVGGSFFASYNALSSLLGAPRAILGIFDVTHNQLQNLEFAPQEVNHYFLVHDNSLDTLAFCPERVSHNFVCWNNPNLGHIQYIHDFKTIHAIHTEHLALKEQEMLRKKVVITQFDNQLHKKSGHKI